jgi:hypothetical protein
MKHIFYLLGMAFAIYEMIWIMDPQSQVNKTKRLRELSKEQKDLEWEQYTTEHKDLLKTKGCVPLAFLIWTLIGLITYNWVAFAIYLVFSLGVIVPISKVTQYSPAYTVTHWLASIVGFTLSIFVILNSYHLHIDLYAWALSVLK